MEQRYSDIKVFINYVPEKQEFIWDPGGSLFQPDDWFEFVLPDNLIVKCRTQHWFDFKSKINHCLNNFDKFNKKYGGQFYKLHGLYHSICLLKSQRNSLVKQVENKLDEYDKISGHTQERIDKICIDINENSKYMYIERGNKAAQEKIHEKNISNKDLN